jgi:hypothetical protein
VSFDTVFSACFSMNERYPAPTSGYRQVGPAGGNDGLLNRPLAQVARPLLSTEQNDRVRQLERRESYFLKKGINNTWSNPVRYKVMMRQLT